MRMTRRIGLAGMGLALASGGAFASNAVLDEKKLPPGYTEMNLDTALEVSQAEERFLIVGATAVWCGPCHRMDDTTWNDDRVAEWVKANAVAIKVDVDEQRESAQKLGVRAMPTTFIFKDGELFDHVVGYRDAEFVLNWFEAIEGGQSRTQQLMEMAGQRPADGETVDVRERVEVIGALRTAERMDDALEETLWLWKHLGDHESERPQRWARLNREISALLNNHDDARGAFSEERDALEARLKQSPDWTDLAEWIDLNNALGDNDKTIEWVERIAQEEDGIETLRAPQAASRLERILITEERWATWGMTLSDPVSDVKGYDGFLRMARQRAEAASEDAEDVARMIEARTSHMRMRTARMHAALLAAEREEEAWAVVDAAKEVFEDANKLHGALVEWALRMGVAERAHLDMLDESDEEHKALASRLKESIAGVR